MGTRNVPILEISFYKVLIDSEFDKEPGYQKPIDEKVFEMVKLNIASLVRRKKFGSNTSYSRMNQSRRRGGNNQTQSSYANTSYAGQSGNHNNTRGSSFMGAGFRGKRG